MSYVLAVAALASVVLASGGHEGMYPLHPLPTAAVALGCCTLLGVAFVIVRIKSKRIQAKAANAGSV